MPMIWKPGRGRMGPMAPLIGRWIAEATSPMGLVTCVRDYRSFGPSYVRLEAEWIIGSQGAAKPYREVCLFGPGDDGMLMFWSYTNDGKKSTGRLADGTDVHPRAVCFEAQMEAGLARQVFWPDADNGMRWAVSSRTRKGWSVLTQHHYHPG